MIIDDNAPDMHAAGRVPQKCHLLRHHFVDAKRITNTHAAFVGFVGFGSPFNIAFDFFKSKFPHDE